MSRRVLYALILCPFAGSAAAQGLGDAAGKETQRRSRVKGSGRVYTADDLRRGAPAAPAAPPATVAPAPPERDENRPIRDAAASRAADEARWRRRQEGLRHHASILEREADESDRAATWAAYGGPMDCAGFVNTTHPRAVARARETRVALARARKALEDFEEEARRAGVPPGWLR